MHCTNRRILHFTSLYHVRNFAWSHHLSNQSYATVSKSPFPAPIASFYVDSPLYSSITPSVFFVWLKPTSVTHSFDHTPPVLLSRTVTLTASAEQLGFFKVFLIFPFLITCDILSWLSLGFCAQVNILCRKKLSFTR